MPREATKLVLGRGEVYFDRFLPGTRTGEGERYLGNTPSFRIQRSIERLERATSYRGRRVAVPGATVAEETSVNFVTDNIDDENLALWFGDEPEPAATVVGPRTETLVVKQGRFYQLGKSVSPAGLSGLGYVSLSIGGVVIEEHGNYSVNRLTGRLHILSGIDDGTTVHAEFNSRNGNAVNFGGKSEDVLGALRFIARNEGVRGRPQNNLYFPMVSISPRGQVDMKSDEWQQWGFDATAMNLLPGTAQVYVTRNPTDLRYLSDEEAIVDEFGNLTVFPYWEDRLHQITNYDWPPAVDFTGI